MTRAADRLSSAAIAASARMTKAGRPCHARLKCDAERCEAATFSGPDGIGRAIVGAKRAGSGRANRGAARQKHEKHTLLPKACFSAATGRPLPRPLSPSGAGIMISRKTMVMHPSSPRYSVKSRPGIWPFRKASDPPHAIRCCPHLPGRSRSSRQPVSGTYCGFWPAEERAALQRAVYRAGKQGLAAAFQWSRAGGSFHYGNAETGWPRLRGFGRIDRLAVAPDGSVVILDYKTNRFVLARPRK